MSGTIKRCWLNDQYQGRADYHADADTTAMIKAAIVESTRETMARTGWELVDMSTDADSSSEDEVILTTRLEFRGLTLGVDTTTVIEFTY